MRLVSGEPLAPIAHTVRPSTERSSRMVSSPRHSTYQVAPPSCVPTMTPSPPAQPCRASANSTAESEGAAGPPVMRAVVGLTWGAEGDGIGDVVGVAGVVVVDADDDGTTSDGSSVGVGLPQPTSAIMTATAQLVRPHLDPCDPFTTAPSLRLRMQPTRRTVLTAAVLHRYRWRRSRPANASLAERSDRPAASLQASERTPFPRG